ncbi:unnamed protein product [Gordionus sp. m RMFG-2023]
MRLQKEVRLRDSLDEYQLLLNHPLTHKSLRSTHLSLEYHHKLPNKIFASNFVPFSSITYFNRFHRREDQRGLADYQRVYKARAKNKFNKLNKSITSIPSNNFNRVKTSHNTPILERISFVALVDPSPDIKQPSAHFFAHRNKCPINLKRQSYSSLNPVNLLYCGPTSPHLFNCYHFTLILPVLFLFFLLFFRYSFSLDRGSEFRPDMSHADSFRFFSRFKSRTTYDFSNFKFQPQKKNYYKILHDFDEVDINHATNDSKQKSKFSILRRLAIFLYKIRKFFHRLKINEPEPKYSDISDYLATNDSFLDSDLSYSTPNLLKFPLVHPSHRRKRSLLHDFRLNNYSFSSEDKIEKQAPLIIKHSLKGYFSSKRSLSARDHPYFSGSLSSSYRDSTINEPDSEEYDTGENYEDIEEYSNFVKNVRLPSYINSRYTHNANISKEGNSESALAKILPSSLTYADLHAYLLSLTTKKFHKFHCRNSYILQVCSDGTVNGTLDQSSELSLKL